jgi:hypothetical protein
MWKVSMPEITEQADLKFLNPSIGLMILLNDIIQIFYHSVLYFTRSVPE